MKSLINLNWSEPPGYPGMYRCNKCGEMELTASKYCPHCGTKMYGVKMVYVVVQTLEYQDFETHYETTVLDIFSTKEAAQAFVDSNPDKDNSHIEFYKENFDGEVHYDILEREVK